MTTLWPYVGLALLLLASCSAFAIVRSVLSDAPTAHTKGWWLEIHIPMWVLLVAATMMVASDPVIRAIIQGASAPSRSTGSFLWPGVSAPILAGALVCGFGLARRGTLEHEHTIWLWPALAGVVALMALADRVRFSDGQLMMLGAFGLIWWRSSIHDYEARRSGELPKKTNVAALGLYCTAVVGALGGAVAAQGDQALVMGQLAVLGAATSLLLLAPGATLWMIACGVIGSLGTAAVVRVSVVAVFEARAAMRTGTGSPFEVVAYSLASSPYLTGVASRSVEVALLLITAVVVASCGSGRIPVRLARMIGGALIGASVMTLGWWLLGS